MKLNKFFILISLLLVFCISLGVVNAAEDVDISVNDMDNVVTVESSINMDDEISAVSEGEIHNSSEICDDIRHATGTYYIEQDYQIDSTLVVYEELIIEGNNHTIYGNGKRAFDIWGNVTIKNLNFVNCSASGSGGAIYWWSTVRSGSVSGCSFVNCSASGSGGAIYWQCPGVMSDCSFVNCFASGSGGAIYSYGFCSVSGCNFINCSAVENGGAIYIYFDCNISGCTFVSCNANDGGALFKNIDYRTGYCAYCIFDNNKATNSDDMGGYWVNIDFNFFDFKYNVTVFPHGLTTKIPNNWVILDIVKSSDEYVVKFVDNYGRDLEGVMPDYDVILTINKLSRIISIKNNTFRAYYVYGTYSIMSFNSGVMLAKNVLLDHEIDVVDCEIGGDAIVNINFTDDISGNITTMINGQVINSEIINNSVTISLSGLGVGMYSIYSFYNDYKFDTSFVTVHHFSKYDMNVSVENITYGQDTIIYVTLPDDANGYVILSINDLNTTKYLYNGKCLFNITELLGAGSYDFSLNFTKDSFYASKIFNGSFNIEMFQSKINISVSDVVCPSDCNVIVTLDAVKPSGIITYYLNSEKYIVKDVSDLGLIIKNLTEGNYSLVVEYSGDSNNTNCSDSCNFNVMRNSTYVMNVSANNAIFGDVVHVVVTLPDDAMGYVGLYINNKYYTDMSVRLGIADFTVGGLNPNNYTLKAVYRGDIKYSSSNVSTNVTIDKLHIDIIPVDLITTYGCGEYFQVKVLDNNKNPVSDVELTLKIYTGPNVGTTVTVTTDNDGIAKYDTSKLSIGTYKVVIDFSNPNYIVDSINNSSITIYEAQKSSSGEENGEESVSYEAQKSSSGEENGEESVSYNCSVNASIGNMEKCGTPLLALLIALISLPLIRRK